MEEGLKEGLFGGTKSRKEDEQSLGFSEALRYRREMLERKQGGRTRGMWHL